MTVTKPQSPLSQQQAIVNKDGTPTAWFMRLWQEQIAINGNGVVFDTSISFSDTAAGNATAARHGFLPKLSGIVTEYLNGTGAWSVPAGGGGDLDFYVDGNYATGTGSGMFFDFGGS